MTNTIDQAEKILRSPVGWLDLNLDFDVETWQNEFLNVKNFLVEHREGEGNIGWRSCCIHGIDTKKTGHWSCYAENETQVTYNWTNISTLVPNIVNFWKQFPVEKFARLRFMELLPGGKVTPHNDAPCGLSNQDFNMMDHMIPINVAITHPLECEMILDTYGKVPWKAGKSFIINITDTHRVNNFSTYPRIHLIAHCIVGNKKREFSKLIVDSYNKSNDN